MLRICWIVLIFIGIALDFCCIKWRSTAKYFFPHENLLFLLTGTLPYEVCSLERYTKVFFYFFLAMAYFCDIRIGLLTIVFSVFAQIVSRSFTTQDSIDFQMKRGFLIIISVGVVIVMMAGLITYVTQLQKRLRQ